MSTEESKFVNLCPVFVSPDIRRTVQFYVEKLGFQPARHFDKIENFAALYRDEIEFIIVQAQQGKVQSNLRRNGAGYDAYIDPATLKGIDLIYEEYRDQGVKIVSEPHQTPYGSYEFVFEDIDGRQIGVGRITDRSTFFTDSEIAP